MSQYRIQIDRSLCNGMASCVKIAPETFDLDQEEIAVVAGPAGERAIEAAECCPFAAIAVFDQASGDQVV
jgi:ferredoxin